MKEYQGVIIGKQQSDFILGGQVPLEVNCEDWEFHLIDPQWKIEHELQITKYFDTFACTIFSGNDVKEMIMMNALKTSKIAPKDVVWLTDNGYFTNGYINFDDRVPAMHANIQNGLGTYQYMAADALRNWNVPEGILKDEPKTFSQYYDKTKLTNEAKELNEEFNKRFGWHWFWFGEGDINEQMKMSPAMSTVRFANGEDCLKPDGRLNHAVTEYGNDGICRKINDSYNQQLKKYHPQYIANRLGFKLNTMNNNDFLTKNDLKTIWNKDTGQYFYVLQKALRPIRSEDRSVLLLWEKAFREDGRITISNQDLTVLPQLEF